MNSDLKTDIIEQAKVHRSVDYASSASVKLGNKAADKIRELAGRLFESEGEEALASLLDLNEARVDLWIAHFLLERTNSSKNICNRALNVIRRYAKGEGLDALAERMWLKEWRS